MYYNLELTVTDECNFACTYCFEGEECQKTTTLDCVDDIFSAIEKMFQSDWFNETFEGVKIGFWGGEPTLRPDILRKIAEQYKDDDRIIFHIYTNGYNVDVLMDVFNECKDKINIQVSYDGGKIHEENRVTRGNVSTTNHVRNNIYKLYENGFQVGLKSTVTYDTLKDMSESWDDIKLLHDDIGSNMTYNITFDYINEQDIELDMDYVKNVFVVLAKKEIKFFKENGYHLFNWFNNTSALQCNFFRYGMAINTNGDMLYCHGCGYSPSVEDFKFGHISDGDLIDKIKRNSEYFKRETPEKCGECFAVCCAMCNIVKYDNSEKEGFLEKWYDLPCQKNQCDIFKEFSKVSIALKDIIRRK